MGGPGIRSKVEISPATFIGGLEHSLPHFSKYFGLQLLMANPLKSKHMRCTPPLKCTNNVYPLPYNQYVRMYVLPSSVPVNPNSIFIDWTEIALIPIIPTHPPPTPNQPSTNQPLDSMKEGSQKFL